MHNDRSSAATAPLSAKFTSSLSWTSKTHFSNSKPNRLFLGKSSDAGFPLLFFSVRSLPLLFFALPLLGSISPYPSPSQISTIENMVVYVLQLRLAKIIEAVASQRGWRIVEVTISNIINSSYSVPYYSFRRCLKYNS